MAEFAPDCFVVGRSWIERERILAQILCAPAAPLSYVDIGTLVESWVLSFLYLVYLQLARTPDCGDFNPKYLKSTQNARCGNYVVMKWDWRVAKCPL